VVKVSAVDAYADQDRTGDLAERHSERAIDELGGKSDAGENQEGRGIGKDMLEHKCLLLFEKLRAFAQVLNRPQVNVAAPHLRPAFIRRVSNIH
jgi:hypothetical protein